MAKKRMRPRAMSTREPFAAQALVGLTPEQLLDKLTVPHVARAAYWRLFKLSARDNTVARRGLRHPAGEVRAQCCQILDHFLDDAALAEVIEHINDPHPKVRAWALHTLACDRCKEGACRPGEDDVVPAAIERLEWDSVAQVRLFAVEALGPAASRNSTAAAALARARENDPDRAVRKAAARFVAKAATRQ